MTPEDLPRAPTGVADATGAPAFGTYEGHFAVVDLRTLRSSHARSHLARLLHHKKWVYVYTSDDEVSVLACIVDGAYMSTAFVTVTDMRSGEVVVDRSILGGPGPTASVSDQPVHGLTASFRSPVGSLRLSRTPGSGHYRLAISSGGPIQALPSVASSAVRTIRSAAGAVPVVGARLPGRSNEADSPAAHGAGGTAGRISIDLSFEAGLTPEISVVAPVEQGGGSVNVTQKVAGLPVRGTVTVAGRTWQVESAVGGIDYTHGYLARHTAWNWAFMVGRLIDGRRIGLNLVAGFNESLPDVNENALWVDDRLIPLDRARFTWDRRDPRARWTVRTLDGSVDLTFTPFAVHSEHKHLVVVDGRLVQPIGVFSGTVRIDGQAHAIREMPGVTEDMDMRW